MPTLTELPSDSLLVVSILAIVLTGLGGALYASRLPNARVRTTRVRPARARSVRVVRDSHEPTVPLVRPVVFEDADASMTVREGRAAASRRRAVRPRQRPRSIRGGRWRAA